MEILELKKICNRKKEKSMEEVCQKNTGAKSKCSQWPKVENCEQKIK